MPINLKQLSQPYLASEEEMQDLLTPVRTTAQLASATNLINLFDKYAGKMAYDSTIEQAVYAVSGVASSAWLPSRGATQVATTAELVDEADPVNTVDKFIGKMVWDSTKGQPVWADGAGVNATWSLSTGVVATTPTT